MSGLTGFCRYCSIDQDCCALLGREEYENFTTSNAAFDTEALRAACVGGNASAAARARDDGDTLEWCKKYCSNCYIDTSQVISFQSLTAADILSSWNVFTVFIFLVVVVTPFVRATLYMISRNATTAVGNSRWLHKFAVMPMLRPYLLGDVIACTILLIAYVATLFDPRKDTMAATSGTTAQSIFLILFVWIVFMTETVPFMLLMQRAYTVRAFVVTFVSCTLLGIAYPVLFACRDLIDMSGWSRGHATSAIETNYQIRKTYMYLLSCWFTGVTLKNHYHLKLKPWSTAYVCTFWFLYIYVTMLSSFDEGQMIDKIPMLGVDFVMAPLILYALFRMPLFFVVLTKETSFWRGSLREDDGPSSSSTTFDDSAIGQVQQLLDENRNILLDYMKLRFRSDVEKTSNDDDDDNERTHTRKRRRVLGTGATASVLAAIYSPDRRDRLDLRGRKPFPVAVKVFTPETISASLLRVFAKEIELMRKLDHPHVASCLGLAIMPPQVCVVLPYYSGGTLKMLLQCQRDLLISRADDDSREQSTKDDDDVERGASVRKFRIGRMVTYEEPLLRDDDDDDDATPSTSSTYGMMRRACRCVKRILKCLLMLVCCVSFCGVGRSVCGQEDGYLHRCLLWCGCCRRRKKRRERDRAKAWSMFNASDSTKAKLLSWNQRLRMAKELTSAVSYLHSMSPAILHRDIKPGNILLDENLSVKLSDFGESSLFDNVGDSDVVKDVVEPYTSETPVKNASSETDHGRDEIASEDTKLSSGNGDSTNSSVLSSLPMTIRGSPLWIAPVRLRANRHPHYPTIGLFHENYHHAHAQTTGNLERQARSRHIRPCCGRVQLGYCDMADHEFRKIVRRDSCLPRAPRCRIERVTTQDTQRMA